MVLLYDSGTTCQQFEILLTIWRTGVNIMRQLSLLHRPVLVAEASVTRMPTTTNSRQSWRQLLLTKPARRWIRPNNVPGWIATDICLFARLCRLRCLRNCGFVC